MSTPLTYDDQTTDYDEGAPFGRKPDGTPYKQSPERRAQAAANMASGRSKARLSSSQRASSGGGRRASKTNNSSPHGVYKSTVEGLFQAPAFGLGLASRFNPVFRLDALAVAEHTPAIAGALADLALENAQFAAVLDRVAQVGPYGGLVVATMPLVLQLAANHGIIAPAPAMGILGATDLLLAHGIPLEEVPRTNAPPEHRPADAADVPAL